VRHDIRLYLSAVAEGKTDTSIPRRDETQNRPKPEGRETLISGPAS
jgi:hypothetical protein